MENPIVIAEAAVNHFGSLPLAVRLLDKALESGAQYVKYQTINPSRVYAPGQYEYGTYNIDDVRWLRVNSTLTDEQFEYLVAYALDKYKYNPIITTAFDVDSLIQYIKTKPDYIKVASGDNDFAPLLDCAFSSGIPVIVSTGMTSIDKVDRLVARYSAYKSRLMLMHCVAEYPHSLAKSALGNILELRQRYDCTVGYSDHTIGHEAAVIAASMGVNIFERHFTLSKENGGLDAKHSDTPSELSHYCSTIGQAKLALQSRLEPSQEELDVAKRARRGLYYKRHLSAGSIITEEDVQYLRPQTDFATSDLHAVLGKKLSTNVCEGRAITSNDWI